MMSLWCDIQTTPIDPPEAMPTSCYSVCHCHACLQFGRVLPICRKSGHVQTVSMRNKLQHMLLWTDSQRIGSTVIWSRKTKSFVHMCICGDEFRCFWETLTQLLILRPRKMLKATILESRKKSENSCSCKSATHDQLVCFAGTNILKTCGHGFGWGNGQGLVRCNWISHHVPIPFPFLLVLTQCISSP